jgi:hypothetical protein
MRYLDLLKPSNSQNEEDYKGSRDKFSRYDHAKGGYERTKKGYRATWLSPVSGLRSGRLLMAPEDGWVLVSLIAHPASWVWVHVSRLDTGVGGL